MNRGNLGSHLSDDQLISLLYGLGDADGHLPRCSECGERWKAMHRALGRTRAETAAAQEINHRKLIVQRQQILERLDRPSPGSHAWRWIPAPAALALLAAALFFSRPANVPQPAPAAANAEADTALFTDVYSMEQDVEPRAAAPIHALFQEASFEPATEERQ